MSNENNSHWLSIDKNNVSYDSKWIRPNDKLNIIFINIYNEKDKK